MTTKEKINAREYYFKLDEKPDFTQLTKTGMSDNLQNVFRFADEYHRDQSKSQTTPQQQTIERLRGRNNEFELLLRMILSDNYDFDENYEIRPEYRDKAEQILSTTEPIDQ